MISQQASTGITVLLIDDEEEDLRYWSDSLKQLSPHYSVLESSNGASGIDLCRDHNVDCVILDLDMPESGFHALLKLIPDRQRPQIAVVILTRLPHPNLHEMAKHNGAQACLLKQTISPQDLDHAIKMAVASVRSVQRPDG